MDREKKKEVIGEIRKRTGKNAYSLVIEAGKTPGLTDSKYVIRQRNLLAESIPERRG